MKSRIEHFCAFCSLSYKSYKQRHSGFKEFTLVSVFSITLMWVVWQDVHVFGFIMWGALLAISEIIHRVRWRSAIRCPHCGFDPVIYRSSPEKAAKMVREFLDHRRNDPHYLLRSQPVLPFRRASGEESKKQRPNEAEM